MREKKWAAQSVLRSRVQILLGVSFLLNFFFLIQFWHRCQNDLFKGKLECLLFHWFGFRLKGDNRRELPPQPLYFHLLITRGPMGNFFTLYLLNHVCFTKAFVSWAISLALNREWLFAFVKGSLHQEMIF